uniref:hypothetical protein n=2 Tax=Bifidobacterium animalis TaxID=28025 RepID=UPI0020C01E3A|nr:hypothetical protein [Bifidobacterium animalis]
MCQFVAECGNRHLFIHKFIISHLAIYGTFFLCGIALDVSPQALSVPDIDNYIGLAHTLFALEDVYSLKVVEADGRACLQADIFQGGRQASELNKILIAWREQAAKLEAGEITKEDYDRWRYNYPKYDTTQRWAKVPSKELSDALIKGLKKQRKDK